MGHFLLLDMWSVCSHFLHVRLAATFGWYLVTIISFTRARHLWLLVATDYEGAGSKFPQQQWFVHHIDGHSCNVVQSVSLGALDGLFQDCLIVHAGGEQLPPICRKSLLHGCFCIYMPLYLMCNVAMDTG